MSYMQFICTSLDLSIHSSKHQIHLQNLGLRSPSFSNGSMQLFQLWDKIKVQESRYFATGWIIQVLCLLRFLQMRYYCISFTVTTLCYRCWTIVELTVVEGGGTGSHECNFCMMKNVFTNKAVMTKS